MNSLPTWVVARAKGWILHNIIPPADDSTLRKSEDAMATCRNNTAGGSLITVCTYCTIADSVHVHIHQQ